MVKQPPAHLHRTLITSRTVDEVSYPAKNIHFFCSAAFHRLAIIEDKRLAHYPRELGTATRQNQ